MEFSRQEYWSGLPFPSPGDLPNPGIEPRSPALQADTLPSEPTLFLGSLRLFAEFCSMWLQDSGPHLPAGYRQGDYEKFPKAAFIPWILALFKASKAEMSPCHSSNLPLCSFSPVFLFHISLTDSSASLFCF